MIAVCYTYLWHEVVMSTHDVVLSRYAGESKLGGVVFSRLVIPSRAL